MQHLYLLELNCDVDQNASCRINPDTNADKEKLNPQATEFRPKRNAAAIAELKISDVIHEENEFPLAE